MRYISSFTIALLLCLSALCATEAYATSAFNDVKAGTELGSSIQALQGKSIINGYPDGTFKPNSPLTRAHASKIMALALELDLNTVQNPNFKDVSTSHSQYRYIAALANAGIINGNNGYFNPQAPLTRGQMAKILVRAYNLQGTAALPFTDTKGQSVEKDVKALFANGITKGVTDTLYGVNNAVTRGQMVIFIHRTITLKQLAELQAQPKPETKVEPAIKPTAPQNATLVASDVPNFKGTLAIEKGEEIVIQRIGETYGASKSEHNDTFSFYVHHSAPTIYYVTAYNRKTGEYANDGRYYHLLPYKKNDNYVMDVYLSHVPIEDTTIFHTNYSMDEKLTITDPTGAIVDPSRYTVKRDGTVSSLVVGMFPVGEYVFHFDLKDGRQKTVAYKTFYEGAKIQFYPYDYFADSERLTIPYDGHWIYGSILDVAQPDANSDGAMFLSYNESELTIQIHNTKEASTTDLMMTILQRDDQRKVKIKSTITITPFANGYIYDVESVYIGEAD